MLTVNNKGQIVTLPPATFGMGTRAYDNWTTKPVTVVAGAQGDGMRTVVWDDGDIAVVRTLNLESLS